MVDEQFMRELMQQHVFNDMVATVQSEIERTRDYLSNPENWMVLLLNGSQNHDFILIHHWIGWNENVPGNFNGLGRCFGPILERHNIPYNSTFEGRHSARGVGTIYHVFAAKICNVNLCDDPAYVALRDFWCSNLRENFERAVREGSLNQNLMHEWAVPIVRHESRLTINIDRRRFDHEIERLCERNRDSSFGRLLGLDLLLARYYVDYLLT